MFHFNTTVSSNSLFRQRSVQIQPRAALNVSITATYAFFEDSTNAIIFVLLSGIIVLCSSCFCCYQECLKRVFNHVICCLYDFCFVQMCAQCYHIDPGYYL
jgi:hypothetical protein